MRMLLRRTTPVLAALTLALAAAAPAASAADPDGSYKGRNVKLRIAKDGRMLQKLKVTMTTFCFGPTLYDNHIAISFAYVPKVRIGPSGKFKGTYKTGDTTVKYSGRRVGRKLRATVDLQYSTCSGKTDFTARRTGP